MVCLNPYIVEVSTDAHTRSKYDIEDESVPPSDRSPYSLALFTGLLFRHLSPIMGGGSQPIAHLLKRRNPPVRLKDSMSLLVIVGFIIPDSLSDIAMMTCLKPKSTTQSSTQVKSKSSARSVLYIFIMQIYCETDIYNSSSPAKQGFMDSIQLEMCCLFLSHEEVSKKSL